MRVVLIPKEKPPRENLAYQQRQHYLEKKRRLRKTFELGKLIEQAVLYKFLLEMKEKLQSPEAENINVSSQSREALLNLNEC